MTPTIARDAVAIIDDLAMDAHMLGAVQITDATIAAVALHYDLEVIHDDTDLVHITRVRPDLMQSRSR